MDQSMTRFGFAQEQSRVTRNPEELSMKFFSANIDSLRKLYINQLQMLFSTERQIIEALPKMIEKATDSQLKQAFQSHLHETKTQLTRVNPYAEKAA
jgi:hypothetical protein